MSCSLKLPHQSFWQSKTNLTAVGHIRKHLDVYSKALCLYARQPLNVPAQRLEELCWSQTCSCTELCKKRLCTHWCSVQGYLCGGVLSKQLCSNGWLLNRELSQKKFILWGPWVNIRAFNNMPSCTGFALNTRKRFVHVQSLGPKQTLKWTRLRLLWNYINITQLF